MGEVILFVCDVNKDQLFASIQDFVDHHDNVRDLLNVIDEQFITFVKSLTNTILSCNFPFLKLIGIKGVCDHIYA